MVLDAPASADVLVECIVKVPIKTRKSISRTVRRCHSFKLRLLRCVRTTNIMRSPFGGPERRALLEQNICAHLYVKTALLGFYLTKPEITRAELFYEECLELTRYVTYEFWVAV